MLGTPKAFYTRLGFNLETVKIKKINRNGQSAGKTYILKDIRILRD